MQAVAVHAHKGSDPWARLAAGRQNGLEQPGAKGQLGWDLGLRSVMVKAAAATVAIAAGERKGFGRRQGLAVEGRLARLSPEPVLAVSAQILTLSLSLAAVLGS